MKIRELFDIKLLKFIFVGIINTAVGSVIMFGLYNLGAAFNFYGWARAGYWISSAANYTVTSVLSFFLNKRFTFQNKSKSKTVPLKFAVCIAAAYLAAYGLAKPLALKILRAAGFYGARFADNAALLFGMIMFTGINYLGQRLFAFAGD